MQQVMRRPVASMGRKAASKSTAARSRGSRNSASIPIANADALAVALARAKESKVALLQSPDMLNGEELGAELGLSRATVDDRRVAGKLLALELGSKRGFRFPRWQGELVLEPESTYASTRRLPDLLQGSLPTCGSALWSDGIRTRWTSIPISERYRSRSSFGPAFLVASGIPPRGIRHLSFPYTSPVSFSRVPH
jgi:hypothetical protein